MDTQTRRFPAFFQARRTLFVERLEERSAPSGFDLSSVADWTAGELPLGAWGRQESHLGAHARLAAANGQVTASPVPANEPAEDIGLTRPGTLAATAPGAVLADAGRFSEARLLGALASSSPSVVESGSVVTPGGDPSTEAGDDPVIFNFLATTLPEPNRYLFKGDVDGEGVIGQPVWFGGLDTLAGPPQLTTTVVLGNYGAAEFSLAVTLAAGEYGIATAQTRNVLGVLSNVAETLV